MRYLVTGHTGFKGTWLTMMLAQQGHSVSGIALDPEVESLFNSTRATEFLDHDFRIDIREKERLVAAVAACNPEIIIHLAAQPLVRESYRDPRKTIETNVIGTLNVLEAAQACSSIRAQLIITTDKVYRNINQIKGYKEYDALGGDDLYSASKAMADILTHSWITSFGGPPTATARAGNVIGGGDFSHERLIPDVIQACKGNHSPELRYPNAVRPWQHVLDCLSGYQKLIHHLLSVDAAQSNQGEWNFGPGKSSFVTVGEVTQRIMSLWGTSHTWTQISTNGFHEAGLLTLDPSKARGQLNWQDSLNLEQTISWTVDWYKKVHEGMDSRIVTLEQISLFKDDYHRADN